MTIPNLEIQTALFEAVAERMVGVMSARLRGAKTPEEIRAAITLANITGAGVDATAIPMWWSLVSEPILDTLIEKEMKNIYLEPMEPGGRNLNRLSWGRTGLRATGAAHAGVAPTLGSTPCVPVHMHSYVKIDEAALRAMMYRFNRQAFLRDDVAAMLAENSLFIKSWVYSALASLMNLCWNGDTGAGAGLNIYDGWLKLAADAAITTLDAGVAYLDTIFPAMYDHASIDKRHLAQDDVFIYTSYLVYNGYLRNVIGNKLSEVGTWNPVTGELKFHNAKVVAVTDFPTLHNAANVCALLSRRANMVCGLVDQPLTIDRDFVLASREHEFSSPLQARAVLADNTVQVAWVPAS